MRKQFASDNYSGICPEAMDCLVEANKDYDIPYGEDQWTEEACNLFRDIFEKDCEVFFVFNGTAGNSLSLASLCQSYHSIICHQYAHIETDECGAPEFFSHGSKLLVSPGPMAKLTPEGIDTLVRKRDDIHYPKPGAISLTQATEFGTTYKVKELEAIHSVASFHSLRIQMDGARIANAIAESGAAPAEMTWKRGVDVLVFGGTKNGISVGEAVIFFERKLAREFDYRCKQAGQLASKMRFIAAQWVGLLRNEAWLRYARNANERARSLRKKLRESCDAKILFPIEANSVFIDMDQDTTEKMQAKGWRFYTFIGEGGARLTCSWDTTEETVDAFVSDFKDCLNS